ncbi:MAG TPA: pilus assembly protein TadG-related protein [Longimicrobiales bacterium]|nr:pilus assembly protein TadG-related protein [Longimicrobiales bacterium]
MNASSNERIRTRLARPVAPWRAWASDERGSATVMVSIAITGLVALLALGIDIGALFNARSEAQRAADAAALAGASAFLEYQESQARSVAEERAMAFATSNDIRGLPIRPEEVTISVNLDSSTVRARVRREGVPTWFAQIFGVNTVDVSAQAVAWAGAGGAAQCVKPFALPDMWEERTQDLNHNRISDPGERWSYDPASGDRYVPYSGPGGASNETGYGASWRDGSTDAQGRRYDRDYGRRVTIKTANPHEAWTSSIFLPWVLPPDPNQPDCGSERGPGGGGGGGGGSGDDGVGGGGGGPDGPAEGRGNGWLKWRERRGDLGSSPRGRGPGDGPGNGGGGGGGGGGGPVERDDGSGRGAARYRQNICSCNASVIDLDTEYMIEPGNMVGPTYQGVGTLIDMDRNAYWDDRSNSLVSEYGMDSPRVVTMAVFHPEQLSSPGRQYVRFNNFVRMFIEDQADPQDPVTGRVLYYVPGLGSGGPGATTGSLVRVLQLIR